MSVVQPSASDSADIKDNQFFKLPDSHQKAVLDNLKTYVDGDMGRFDTRMTKTAIKSLVGSCFDGKLCVIKDTPKVIKTEKGDILDVPLTNSTSIRVPVQFLRQEVQKRLQF
ncbi:MAG: hypothetical protein M3Q64_00180 [bacterium]|nr:hypothetical protein [bacterium]